MVGMCTYPNQPIDMSISTLLLYRIAGLLGVVIVILSISQVFFLVQLPNLLWVYLFSIEAPLIAFAYLTPLIQEEHNVSNRFARLLSGLFLLCGVVWCVLGSFLFYNNHADCSDCTYTSRYIHQDMHSKDGIVAAGRELIYLGATSLFLPIFSWVLILCARIHESGVDESYAFLVDTSQR